MSAEPQPEPKPQQPDAGTPGDPPAADPGPRQPADTPNEAPRAAEPVSTPPPAEPGPTPPPAEPGPTPPTQADITRSNVPREPRAVPRPATAAEIAASMTDLDDPQLEQDVEAALAGVTEEELAGATAKQPVADEPSPGGIVEGRIANIGSEDVLIDFGGKQLGAMSLQEFERGEEFAVGDTIEVMIVKEDTRAGLLQVSRRQAKQAAILRDLRVGLVLEARVTGMNKGGLEAVFEGLRGFIPASQVAIGFIKDISNLIGQTVRVEVTQFDKNDDDPNVVLSRRKVLIREEAERRERLFAELEVGDVRRGRVRSTTDFGAFVDIGGVDGLLHVRDMSWGRVNRPDDVVRPGDEIDVKIIKLQKDTKKVSLSLKQTIANPWESVEEKYQPGAKVQGRVVRLADFGAFVELELGVDGLLPCSEMSWTRRIRNPGEIVKEGDIVEVAVLSVDAKKRRISLSLKSMKDDPWTTATATYAAGSTVKGKVVRTTEFGAFVQLEDGIDGLVHISEISDHHVKAVSDEVSPGQYVDVRVLGVDTEAKRISLSMRKPPPEPTAEEIAKIHAERAALEKKRAARPKRGGITFGWDQGLGSLDPSQFSR